MDPKIKRLVKFKELLSEVIKKSGDNGEEGRLADLSRKLGISHNAIINWTQIPIGRVEAISKITGIPEERLRPDVYKGMVRKEGKR